MERIDLSAALELADIRDDEYVILCRNGSHSEVKMHMKASDVKKRYDLQETKVQRILPCIDEQHHYVATAFILCREANMKHSCSRESDETPVKISNNGDRELPPIFFDMDGSATCSPTSL